MADENLLSQELDVSASLSPSNVESVLQPGPMPRLDQDGHVVQLYTDDALLLNVLSRFIGGALAMGDGAIVIATRTHRDGLAQRLEARGVDTSKALSEGRYVLLDAEETLHQFMVNGVCEEERFISTVGRIVSQVQKVGDNPNYRVAAFGELVALLWAEGKPDQALRVEEFWNNLAKKHSFSLLCAYPITSFTNEKHVEPFLRMCGLHGGVVPTEGYIGLSGAEERLRTIAHLQQKAQALERELLLRQSEERFQLLVDAVQDYAIFMMDPEGNIRSWNSGARRIKGYNSADILGKHFSCFYPEEDVRNGKPKMELEVAAKEGRFEDEGWRLRKDGSRFWANVIITAIRDKSGKLIGFGKVTRDFTERMRMQRALEEEIAEKRAAEVRLHSSEASLRQLSLHLLRTQDEERRRIGRDLHDSLGQYLAALKIKLDLISMSAEQKDSEDPAIAECIRLVEDSIKEVRTISYLMYPPMLEEMGLQSAIRWYLDGFSSRSGIRATFEVDKDFRRIDRDVELAIFRVLQESLTNVHRHSGSDTAHIRLSAEGGRVTLAVTDRGKGIPSGLVQGAGRDWTGAPGVGLRGMNERMRQLGGWLEVVSNGEGTTVTATVPAGESTAEEAKSA